MGKNKKEAADLEQWFKNKLDKYKNDPVFILEGIMLELEELIVECKELQKRIEKGDK